MATGSAISAVFCTAAPLGARPWFSQYSRPAEVSVFVSQYSVKLSSTSSFVSDCADRCCASIVRSLAARAAT
jgi:hypothetical protein